MKKKCKSGKIKLDKKGAVTLMNLTMKLQRIEMKMYLCPVCKYWHLTTNGEHRTFRRVVKKRK